MKKKIIIILTFFCLLIGIDNVKADMGPKPSIEIYLKNIETTEYTIDLLTKHTDDNFYSYLNVDYFEYKNTPLYKYNKDGWMATTVRTNLLWGNIEGNSSKKHRFSYFGTPSTFKVIIQFKDGTIKTSDIIERTKFNYEMYLDVSTMKVEKKYGFNLAEILKCMLITVVVEIIIAKTMKINHLKQITLINIFTQIIIQLLRLTNFPNYIFSLILAELIVFIIEYEIYKVLFKKDTTNKRILIYTIIANLITAIATLI